MAGIRDQGLKPQGPWPAGLNNISEEQSLPVDAQSGQPIALREATNVDLAADGKPHRRGGYSLVAATTLSHSAWSNEYLPYGLYVDNGVLKAFFSDETTQVLVSGLANLPMSYDRFNDLVFWTNGIQCGMLDASLAAYRWGCITPAGQPNLSSQDGGSLDAGSYQVAVTFVDARGRESGSPLAVAIDVVAGSSVVLSDIPQPEDTTTKVRLYMTGGNDGVLRQVALIAYGVRTYTISQRPAGRPIATHLLRSMPSGQIVRYHNGRHFVAKGREVMYSPALRYGMLDPKKNRVLFAGDIELMEPVGDGGGGAGLFVADGHRTYFLGAADPAEWSQVIVVGCGAVPGTACTMPGESWGLETKQPLPVWLGRDGHWRVGMPGGRVETLKMGEAVLDMAESGASLYRESNGVMQLVTSLKGAHSQPLAIRDQMTVRDYTYDPS